MLISMDLYELITFLLISTRLQSIGWCHQQSTLFGDEEVDETFLGAQVKRVKELLRDYDWRVRPAGKPNLTDGHPTDQPVIVTVNLYLRTISKVDDVNMEYNVHFTFREQWQDRRLAYGQSINLSHLVIPTDATIWQPDTFFQNEKNGVKHVVDQPNVLIRVSPSGDILYSVRVTLVLSCIMDLSSYPMDRQECTIDLASYGYTEADIVYQWKEENPVQIKAGLRSSLPTFALTDVQTTLCTSKTNTGVYSCLRTILVLKREFSYYMLQVYLPSFMLVGVSWVSFWLDKESVPARVTLGITTLLTMTTQASGVNAKLPPVSYMKAIDIWIGVCLAFIFGALVEFALVNYFARCETGGSMHYMQGSRRIGQRLAAAVGKQAPVDSDVSPMLPPKSDVSFFEVPTTPGTTRRLSYLCFVVGQESNSKRIDMFSRIVFPLTFAIFNAGYWAHYLVPYLRLESHLKY